VENSGLASRVTVAWLSRGWACLWFFVPKNITSFGLHCEKYTHLVTPF
jgi:hypothetical protein